MNFFLLFLYLSIDNGYYLHQAELKVKREKVEAKTSIWQSRTMFAVDPTTDSASSSGNDSDEDLVLHHKK